MKLPTVSAFCATYGRPPRLVEESIESFLRQDYEGERELIVLNDFDRQTFTYNGDERVRIFNNTSRIMPLGRKFNTAISLCNGEIIMPWDDDDIFLPHRMTLTVERMKNDFFHSYNAWFYDGGDTVKQAENYFMCNMAVSRDLLEEVGGYDERDVSSIDVSILTRLKEVSGTESQPLSNEEIFYIYRWNTGSYHGSGWGGGVTAMELVTLLLA